MNNETPPPGRTHGYSALHRGRGAVLLILVACGCSTAATDFAAHPRLTPYSWGVRFTSTNPAISFPLPAGWVFAPAGGAPATVRLQSADGACQLLLSRAEATESAAAARDALGAALLNDGHTATSHGTQQVGNLQAQRLDARFDKDVQEQLFTMQTGAWLLTLTTVRSPRCRMTFDDTLTGLRAGS